MKPLSASEMEIMEAMWESGKEMTSFEISDYITEKKGKTWVMGTLNSFLSRMDKKGVFITKRIGKQKIYKPISREAYNRLLINKSLYNNFGYEFDKLLMNFVGTNDSNNELVKKAQALLEELKNDD